jgi:hypothetical protein
MKRDRRYPRDYELKAQGEPGLRYLAETATKRAEEHEREAAVERERARIYFSRRPRRRPRRNRPGNNTAASTPEAWRGACSGIGSHRHVSLEGNLAPVSAGAFSCSD